MRLVIAYPGLAPATKRCVVRTEFILVGDGHEA